MLYPCIGSLCRGVTTQLHVHFPTLTLFTTAGTAARVRRCSPWRHIYAISPQPSTHFMSPCKVHFTLLPLLLTSPCGVLPPAGRVSKRSGRAKSDGERKGCGSLLSVGQTVRAQRDAFPVKTKRRGPTGGSYIAHFSDLRGDWQLGSHRHSGTASIINGYGLWHALSLCEYVSVGTCVFILTCIALISYD